jgi:hypothetical protein
MFINKPKDRHLNLFRLYRGSESIENNITRALGLLLQNDALFFREFIGHIINDKVFDHFEENHTATIDIQVDASFLEDEAISRVYGVTLTTNLIKQADFKVENTVPIEGKKITDLVIRLKDILIIIEVKRTNEHCVAQLKGQVAQTKINKEKVTYKSLTWEKVMYLGRRTRNVYNLVQQQSPILEDFRSLIASEYAEWLPTKPFKFIDIKDKK